MLTTFPRISPDKPVTVGPPRDMCFCATQPISSSPLFSLRQRTQIEVLYLGTLLRLLNEQIPFEPVSAQKLQERAFHFILEIDRFVSAPELGRQRKHLVALCQSILASLSRCVVLPIPNRSSHSKNVSPSPLLKSAAGLLQLSMRQRQKSGDEGVTPVATSMLFLVRGHHYHHRAPVDRASNPAQFAPVTTATMLGSQSLFVGCPRQ